MPDGFRTAADPAPEDMGAFVLAPGNYYVGHFGNFNSAVLSLLYTGNPAFPATGDYMRVQLLWRAPDATILWADTVELNSTHCPAFAGKRQFLHVPVRGPWLMLAVAAGSGGVAGTLDALVYGSRTVVSRAVFGSDQASFQSSDNIVLATSGGVLAPGVAAATAFGALASGPATIRFAANFAAAGVSARWRGNWGSTANGPPDLVAASTGAGSTVTVYQTGVLLPRRPIRAFVQNITGAGNVNSWNFEVIRDEP